MILDESRFLSVPDSRYLRNALDRFENHEQNVSRGARLRQIGSLFEQFDKSIDHGDQPIMILTAFSDL
jgi:hypothetical protein